MAIKGAIILLLVLAILGVFGRFRTGGRRRPPTRRVTARCAACGRPRIGPGPCDCGRS